MTDLVDWTALVLLLFLLGLRVHPHGRAWAPRGLRRPPSRPATGAAAAPAPRTASEHRIPAGAR